jgi:hypothetical protein
MDVRHSPESSGHLPQIPGAGSCQRAAQATRSAPREQAGDERNSRHERQVRRPNRLRSRLRGTHGTLGHRLCCLAGLGSRGVRRQTSRRRPHRVTSSLKPRSLPRGGVTHVRRFAARRIAPASGPPHRRRVPGAETPRAPDLRRGVGRPPLRAGAAHPPARSAVSLPRSSPRLPRQGAHAPRPLPFFFYARNARSSAARSSGPLSIARGQC